MPETEKLQKQNVGNAGEYYIASRLSAINFTVTITLGRAEKFDILALGPKGKLVKISVKTTQLENAKDFPLSAKDEVGASDDFYYAFVKLNKFLKEPDFWIIPSTVVCPLLKNSDEIWLRTPGKNDREHKGSTMRILPIEVRKSQLHLYPEKWSEDVTQYYKNLNQLI
jgi:hypothetical protein